MSEELPEPKIAELPIGALWTRYGTFTTREEALLLERNQMPPERAREIAARIAEAARILNEMVCPGWQDWMDRRRAMN